MLANVSTKNNLPNFNAANLQDATIDKFTRTSFYIFTKPLQNVNVEITIVLVDYPKSDVDAGAYLFAGLRHLVFPMMLSFTLHQ